LYIFFIHISSFLSERWQKAMCAIALFACALALFCMPHNGLALGAVADFGAQNCQYTTKVDAR